MRRVSLLPIVVSLSLYLFNMRAALQEFFPGRKP